MSAITVRRDIWSERLSLPPAQGRWNLYGGMIMFRCPLCGHGLRFIGNELEFDKDEFNVTCDGCNEELANVTLEMYGNPPA